MTSLSSSPAPAHSTLGASTAERWTACPASVRLSKGIESKSSVYAEEGTRAHEVAATVLTTGGWPLDVPEDMVEAVKVYLEHVNTLMKVSGKAELFIEQRLDLSSVHPKMFGTADAVVYFPHEKLLHVIDYKHGAGTPVDVKENLQLQYYGLGSMLMLNRPVERVVLTIVQPRCFHVDGMIRSWELHAFAMLDLAADLKAYADKTEDPSAPIVPGEWCRWCPAAAICPGLANQAQALAKTQFSAQPFADSTGWYDKVALAETLTKLDVVEDWAKSVREFAYHEAMRGQEIPGFKLVAKRATRKWHSYANANTLAENFGGDKLRYLEMELRSPAAVEKLLEKEQRPKLEEFVEKVSSGLALVPESDKRHPALLRDAKADFTQVTYAESGIFD